VRHGFMLPSIESPTSVLVHEPPTEQLRRSLRLRGAA
jgi:hypothetical protein